MRFLFRSRQYRLLSTKQHIIPILKLVWKQILHCKKLLLLLFHLKQKAFVSHRYYFSEAVAETFQQLYGSSFCRLFVII
jgi:hypothetical protein